MRSEVSVYLQEVAVKKFLDQDFYGDALDEFRSEVGEIIWFFLSKSCTYYSVYTSFGIVHSLL